MRLSTLLKKARETEGLEVTTRQTVQGEGTFIVDYFETRILDYRNENGKVGKTFKKGVVIYHAKREAGFDDAIRADIELHLATSIRTVKQVASLFDLS